MSYLNVALFVSEGYLFKRYHNITNTLFGCLELA
jgi:hypothetical protein